MIRAASSSGPAPGSLACSRMAARSSKELAKVGRPPGHRRLFKRLDGPQRDVAGRDVLQVLGGQAGATNSGVVHAKHRR